MKSLLIQPPCTQSKHSMKRCMPPLGLAYIASFIRDRGNPVKILDCVVEGYNTEINTEDKITYGLTDSEIKSIIQEYKPDIVGVSCLMSNQHHNAHRVCKIAKGVNPKTRTVMGGCHPSALSSRVLEDENVDQVVVGEGEQAFLSIVNGNIDNVVKMPPINLNNLPMPARDLLPIEKYMEIDMHESVYSMKKRVMEIETSRGCNYGCVFCSTTRLWGKWRGRDPEKVLEEIKIMKENYKCEEIDFMDANLLIDRDRAYKIFKGMVGMNLPWSTPGGAGVNLMDKELITLMKKSGCYQLTFAVESSNQKILSEVINKPLKLELVKPLIDHCNKIGLDTHAFFVVGFPEQTREDIINDYKYAKKMNFTSISFNIVSPLPGSRIYDKYSDQIDLSRIEYRHAHINHPTIKSQDLEKLVAGLNKKFNVSAMWRKPKFFFRKHMRVVKRKHQTDFLKKMFTR